MEKYFCDDCEALAPCVVRYKFLFFGAEEVCSRCGSSKIAPADGAIARSLRSQKANERKRAHYKALGIKHPRY